MSTGSPAADPDSATACPESRRARKKRELREAMIDAALRLFHDRGFDATTVREIADAVDVAERTFFRYFASKEELATSVLERQSEHVLAALRARPADEPPLLALRNAFHNGVDSEPRELERYLSVMQAVGSAPALMVAMVAWASDSSKPIIAELAAREGVDPLADPRPGLLVTVFWSVIAQVLKDSYEHPGAELTHANLGQHADRYLDQLLATVDGHWH